MSSCFSAWNGCDLIMHPMTSTELQVLERHISSLGQTRLGARGTSVTAASLAAWLQFAWVDSSGHNLVSFVVTHQSWYCWSDVGGGGAAARSGVREEGQRCQTWDKGFCTCLAQFTNLDHSVAELNTFSFVLSNQTLAGAVKTLPQKEFLKLQYIFVGLKEKLVSIQNRSVVINHGTRRAYKNNFFFIFNLFSLHLHAPPDVIRATRGTRVSACHKYRKHRFKSRLRLAIFSLHVKLFIGLAVLAWYTLSCWLDVKHYFQKKKFPHPRQYFKSQTTDGVVCKVVCADTLSLVFSSQPTLAPLKDRLTFLKELLSRASAIKPLSSDDSTDSHTPWKSDDSLDLYTSQLPNQLFLANWMFRAHLVTGR